MSVAETLEAIGPGSRREISDHYENSETTLNHATTALLLVSDELVGIKRNADLSQQDIEDLVRSIKEVFMDVSEADMSFDDSQAVSLLQGSIYARPVLREVDESERQSELTDFLSLGPLQRASYVAIEFLSRIEGQGGCVARHQIGDIVVRLHDVVTDYIDYKSDVDPDEVTAYLSEEFFFRRLRYSDKGEGAPAFRQIGGPSPSAEVGRTAWVGFSARVDAPVPV